MYSSKFLVSKRKKEKALQKFRNLLISIIKKWRKRNFKDALTNKKNF